MPFDPKRYPPDWRAISRRIRERDGHRCKWCGLRNYSVGHRDTEGRFVHLSGNGPCDAAGQGLRWPSMEPLTYAEARTFADELNDHDGGTDADGNRWVVIVLTVAHLGAPRDDGSPGDAHDKHDVRDANLAALCQKCHLGHDLPEHMKNAAATRRRKQLALQPELFEAPNEQP